MSSNIDNFGNTVFRGTIWIYGAFYGSKLVVFLSTVILARLLTKEEFGLIGYAVTFIGFLDVFRDLGIGTAVIYYQGNLKVNNTAFWMGLAIGIGIFISIWFLAPIIGEFFNDNRIVNVIRVLALNYPLFALGGIHESLLIKELAFNKKFLPDFARAFIKGILSIGLAIAGFGPWSLIIGHLSGTLAGVVVLWRIVPWKPSFEFLYDAARSLLQFGLPIVSVNILGVILLNSDYIFVGRYLGAVQLGVYSVAFRIPELFVLHFCAIVAQVLFPIFSKMRDDENALVIAFLQTAKFVSLITVPLGLGMVLLARPFILVFFTDKWLEAIPIMQSIAIYAIILSLGYNAGDVYKALGVPGILTRISLIKMVFLIPGLWWAITYPGTLIAVSMVQIAVAFIGSIINFIVALRLLKIHRLTLMKSLTPSLISGSGMAIVLWFFIILSKSINPWIQLTVGVLIGGLVYSVILWQYDPQLFKTGKRLISSAFLKQ